MQEEDVRFWAVSQSPGRASRWLMRLFRRLLFWLFDVVGEPVLLFNGQVLRRFPQDRCLEAERVGWVLPGGLLIWLQKGLSPYE